MKITNYNERYFNLKNKAIIDLKHIYLEHIVFLLV